jgi:plasmid replication initiation protein
LQQSREKNSTVKGKITTKAQKSRGGRHTDILEIRPDRLVTNPLSAQILLMLAEMSKKSREVNETVFMEHLLKELNYLKADYKDLSTELTARINFLTKIGDICNADHTVPGIIWISWLRYHSQKAYLQLLVKENLPKPRKS